MITTRGTVIRISPPRTCPTTRFRLCRSVHSRLWYHLIRPSISPVLDFWSKSDLEGNHDKRESHTRHAAQDSPCNSFQATRIGPFTFVVPINQAIYSPGTRTCGQSGMLRISGFGFWVSGIGFQIPGIGCRGMHRVLGF